jgi:glycosyltransferase involved in cell wall biosynthesis
LRIYKNIWLINIGEPIPIMGNRPHRMNYWFNFYSSKGHCVKFFTTDFEHQRKISINSIPSDYILLKSYIKYYNNISLARLLNHFFVAISFMRQSKIMKIKPDVIIVSYPSIFLCLCAVFFAKKNKIKIVVDYRDKWPDIFIKNTFFKVFIFPLLMIKKFIVKNATLNISISEEYLKWATSNCEIHTNTNSIIPLVNIENPREVVKVYDTNEILNFIFIGTLGLTYDLDVILILDDILQKLNFSYKIFICGDGPEKNNFIKKITNRKNIVFLGWVDENNLTHYLNISHFGLMFYYSNSPQGWPNKLFEYMAYGLPILNTLKGESETLIQENQLGLNFNKYDLQKIENWFIQMDNIKYQSLRSNNIIHFNNNFSQTEIHKKLEYLID